jgi:hypothetical protein
MFHSSVLFKTRFSGHDSQDTTFRTRCRPTFQHAQRYKITLHRWSKLPWKENPAVQLGYWNLKAPDSFDDIRNWDVLSRWGRYRWKCHWRLSPWKRSFSFWQLDSSQWYIDPRNWITQATYRSGQVGE